MKEYTIRVYNDMGHLEIMPSYAELPIDIADFIMFNCLRNYSLKLATDTAGLGCRFYILSEEANKRCIFNYNNNTTIIIEYDLDTFNPDRMIWLS
jgi:hypothetical protein